MKGEEGNFKRKQKKCEENLPFQKIAVILHRFSEKATRGVAQSG